MVEYNEMKVSFEPEEGLRCHRCYEANPEWHRLDEKGYTTQTPVGLRIQYSKQLVIYKEHRDSQKDIAFQSVHIFVLSRCESCKGINEYDVSFWVKKENDVDDRI